MILYADDESSLRERVRKYSTCPIMDISRLYDTLKASGFLACIMENTMRLIADFYTVERDPENEDNVRERKTATIMYDSDTNTVFAAEGSQWKLRSLSEDGAMGKEQVRYYPKDGEKFMRALPYLAGSYCGVILREEK